MILPILPFAHSPYPRLDPQGDWRHARLWPGGCVAIIQGKLAEGNCMGEACWPCNRRRRRPCPSLHDATPFSRAAKAAIRELASLAGCAAAQASRNLRCGRDDRRLDGRCRHAAAVSTSLAPRGMLAEFTGRARQLRDAIAAGVAVWPQSGRMHLLVLTSEFAYKKRPKSALRCGYSSIPEQPHQPSAPLPASVACTIACTSAAAASPYANRDVDCIAQPASVMTAMVASPASLER